MGERVRRGGRKPGLMKVLENGIIRGGSGKMEEEDEEMNYKI